MIDLSVRYREPLKGGRNHRQAPQRLRISLLAIILLSVGIACRGTSQGSEGRGVERKGGPDSEATPVAVGEKSTRVAVNRPHDSAPASGKKTKVRKVERLSIKVLAAFPHDPGAFTQGLVWDGGVLYESTGLYGRSSLRRVEPATGQVMAQRAVDPNLFGEGLTRVGDRLLQLTWKAGIVLVYDLASLELIDEYGFNGQGWGLAHDGQRLVMSDGSHRLTFRDLEDFRWLSTLEVTLGGQPLENINELEFAEGRLYANVWGEEQIVRIDPETGEVDAVIDASNLLSPAERSRVDVLNGIAYDPLGKTFWLTGKFWPRMFQVVLESAEE